MIVNESSDILTLIQEEKNKQCIDYAIFGDTVNIRYDIASYKIRGNRPINLQEFISWMKLIGYDIILKKKSDK